MLGVSPSVSKPHFTWKPLYTPLLKDWQSRTVSGVAVAVGNIVVVDVRVIDSVSVMIITDVNVEVEVGTTVTVSIGVVVV